MATGASAIGLLVLVVSPSSERAITNPAAAAETNALASNIPNIATTSFDWRSVESEDYRNYIANLRDIGCPEETIRDIITADVNKLFEERRKGLPAVRTNRFEYWKTGSQRFTQAFSAEKIEAQQSLAKERRAVLKELLGVEPEERPEAMPGNPLEERLDFLVSSKRAAVIELEQRHVAKSIKAMGSSQDFKRVRRELERDKEIELAALLTPEELEDYQLRHSGVAGRMANELDGFNPSEQEFRALFRIRKQIEDEFGLTQNDRLGSAATAKWEEELRNLLGDARFADYERLPVNR